eukprot:6455910-Amphidinium_carterae.2
MMLSNVAVHSNLTIRARPSLCSYRCTHHIGTHATGMIPAVFTFGLSVPVGALVGCTLSSGPGLLCELPTLSYQLIRTMTEFMIMSSPPKQMKATLTRL